MPGIDALPMPWRAIAYAAAFALGLILLERGADWFVDAIAVLAKRLRAPQILVGLLTAGGEWEELVVVVAAVLGGHGGIAVGDIVGSVIANVLGAFPLGLFGRKPLVVERSARLYAVAMGVVVLFVSGLLATGPVTRTLGGGLVALFAVYVASILLALRKGMLRPSDLPADDGDDGDDDGERVGLVRRPVPALLALIVAGFAIVSLGAYLVVEPAVYFAHLFGLSEVVIGLTVVAIGTTLPDKAISLAGGIKAQGGVVVANAVGSNIFLLTLVLGLSALAEPVIADAQTARFDVPVMLAATLLLCLLLLVRTGLHRRTGVAMLLLYTAYLAYQFVGK